MVDEHQHQHFPVLLVKQLNFQVNGHLLANIMREFLLDDVDQSIHGTWRANFMSVDVFTTRSSPVAGTISGVLTKGRSCALQWKAGNLPTFFYTFLHQGHVPRQPTNFLIEFVKVITLLNIEALGIGLGSRQKRVSMGVTLLWC